MRFRDFMIVAMVAMIFSLLLMPGAAYAVDAIEPGAVAASAPAAGVTGVPTLDIILAIVGAINILATSLAALLPQNSTFAIIAKVADLANRLGITLKPKAIIPKDSVPKDPGK